MKEGRRKEQNWRRRHRPHQQQQQQVLSHTHLLADYTIYASISSLSLTPVHLGDSMVGVCVYINTKIGRGRVISAPLHLTKQTQQHNVGKAPFKQKKTNFEWLPLRSQAKW